MTPYGHGRWCPCDPCVTACEELAEARAADEPLSEGEMQARENAYERSLDREWGDA